MFSTDSYISEDSESLKKIRNRFTNKGTRTFSVRDVFNKIIVVCTHDENRYFSDANYSIKHNSKVLLEGVLQLDMYLRLSLKNSKLVQK